MKDEGDQPVSTPCVKVCVVEPRTRLCIGCLRSIDEIAGWSRMTEAQRQEIMAALPGRKPQLTARRGGREGRIARRTGQDE